MVTRPLDSPRVLRSLGPRGKVADCCFSCSNSFTREERCAGRVSHSGTLGSRLPFLGRGHCWGAEVPPSPEHALFTARRPVGCDWRSHHWSPCEANRALRRNSRQGVCSCGEGCVVRGGLACLWRLGGPGTCVCKSEPRGGCRGSSVSEGPGTGSPGV